MKKYLCTLTPLAIFAIGLFCSPALAADADDEKLTMPTILKESFVRPDYPEDARKAGAEGTVIIQVLVTKHGEVGAVTLREGIEEFPSMDRAAITAVRQWRFEPATKDGKPVDLEVDIPIQFALGDKACEKK
jgi:protein TonB